MQIGIMRQYVAHYGTTQKYVLPHSSYCNNTTGEILSPADIVNQNGEIYSCEYINKCFNISINLVD